MNNYCPSVITSHDAMKITGNSISTCRRLLRKIKKHFRKTGPRKYVSVSEFSSYTGIPIPDILRALT